MWLVSLWKEDKTNWQVWQALVLSLAGRDGSWQQKELNAQTLKLSDSRCLFKERTKDLLEWSWEFWVCCQWEGNILLCFSPLCALNFCAVPTPYSPISCLHLLRKCHPKAGTWMQPHNFPVTTWLCILPAELIAWGSVKRFHLPSSVAVL